LFCSTHLPGLQLGGPPQSDKLVHFVAFSILAFLFWRGCQSASRTLGPQFIWTALPILIAYAGGDEYLQQFVGRGTEWEDFASDTVGIIATVVVLEWLRRRSARIFARAG